MTDPGASKSSQFIRRSLLGGLVVLLPIAILALFFQWLYSALSGFIEPLTAILVQNLGLPDAVADAVVLALLIVICFTVGHLVSTRLGSWLWSGLERGLMERLPGYLTLRDIVAQLLGGTRGSTLSRRTEVARVWLYGRDVDASVMALVTAWHADGRMTVFVPTGPNPTSGFIYHVGEDLVVTYPEAAVDRMMKTIIACGTGSERFVEQIEKDHSGKGQGAASKDD